MTNSLKESAESFRPKVQSLASCLLCVCWLRSVGWPACATGPILLALGGAGFAGSTKPYIQTESQKLNLRSEGSGWLRHATARDLSASPTSDGRSQENLSGPRLSTRYEVTETAYPQPGQRPRWFK